MIIQLKVNKEFENFRECIQLMNTLIDKNNVNSINFSILIELIDLKKCLLKKILQLSNERKRVSKYSSKDVNISKLLEYITINEKKYSNYISYFIFIINNLIQELCDNHFIDFKRDLETENQNNDEIYHNEEIKTFNLLTLYYIKASTLKFIYTNKLNYIFNKNISHYLQICLDSYIKSIKLLFTTNFLYSNVISLRLLYSYCKFLNEVCKDEYRSVLFIDEFIEKSKFFIGNQKEYINKENEMNDTNNTVKDMINNMNMYNNTSEFDNEINRIIGKFKSYKSKKIDKFVECLKNYFPMNKDDIIKL